MEKKDLSDYTPQERYELLMYNAPGFRKDYSQMAADEINELTKSCRGDRNDRRYVICQKSRKTRGQTIFLSSRLGRNGQRIGWTHDIKEAALMHRDEATHRFGSFQYNDPRIIDVTSTECLRLVATNLRIKYESSEFYDKVEDDRLEETSLKEDDKISIPLPKNNRTKLDMNIKDGPDKIEL